MALWNGQGQLEGLFSTVEGMRGEVEVVDGGCQGGKEAVRKPLVEGDVREEEEG